MNCTIVRGRFNDEVICQPFELFGIPITYKVMLILIFVAITLIMIRVDKIFRLCVGRWKPGIPVIVQPDDEALLE